MRAPHSWGIEAEFLKNFQKSFFFKNAIDITVLQAEMWRIRAPGQKILKKCLTPVKNSLKCAPVP